MAGLTQAQYETQLSGWYDVMTKIQNGEEVRRGDRVLKLSDLKEVRETIDWLETKIKSFEQGETGNNDITPRSMIPIDEI